MRRYALLLLLALVVSCDATQETGMKLALIESPDAGLALRELPPHALKSIGLPYGLAVVKAGALAERAGLRIGDVVYGVNQKKVKNLEEFNRLLAQQGGGRLGLLVRRGKSDFYVAVDFAGAAGRGDGQPKGMPGARDTLLRT